jgi:hypothetical protein
MSHKHIQLEINNHKIATSVFVNDVLVFTNRFHKEAKKELSINQWVSKGLNTVRVNLAINPQWFEELKEQSFDTVIALYEGVEDNLTKTILKEIHWKYTLDTQFPVNIADEFELDIPYGNWAWLNADVLSDEKFNIESLKQYITNLHEILDHKDYNNLAPIVHYKSSELAAAYGIPIDERISDQKSFFIDELFKYPSWGLLPLNLEDLTFQYHANGRLIQVLNIRGKSPIQSNTLADDVNFSIDLFLCHKDGEWILCR